MKDLIEETLKNLNILNDENTLFESLVDTNVHKLEEMGEIANFKYNIYICVYAREGYVPHFHVYIGNKALGGKEKKKSMKSACLQFKENAYFAHNKDCEDKLNNDELDKIMEIMMDRNKEDSSKTNWEASILLWNWNNASRDERKRLDLKTKMPNYKDPRYPK